MIHSAWVGGRDPSFNMLKIFVSVASDDQPITSLLHVWTAVKPREGVNSH